MARNQVVWYPVTNKSNQWSGLVVMRYDDPDGRWYQIGFHDGTKLLSPWTDGNCGILQAPDYYANASDIENFIVIPDNMELIHVEDGK